MILYFSNRCVCMPLKMITVAAWQQSIAIILGIVYSDGYQNNVVFKKIEPVAETSLIFLDLARFSQKGGRASDLAWSNIWDFWAFGQIAELR